jgi:lipoprotein-anchoring transpeptidase ErfK/SrfK
MRLRPRALALAFPVLIALALAPLAGPSGGSNARAAEATPSTTTRYVAASAWTDPDDIPLADWARSVEVLRDDEPLFASPAGSRRALIANGVRLPLLGAVRAPGCVQRWLLVGPLAYVCADKVKLTADPPGVDESIHPTPADGLPYRYYFVGAGGAQAYGKLGDIDDETPVEQLDRGWAIAGVGTVSHGGRSYVKTRRGRLVSRAEIGPVTAFGFHGETLTRSAGEAVGVGWVNPEKANVFAEPKPGAKVVGQRLRLQKVDVLEQKKVSNTDTFVRIGDAQWMKLGDVRTPTPATPPDGIAVGERWIDVELATQTLVAFEGAKPIFATVVSTGRGPGTTPKGVHRIWVKLRSSTMSNADDGQDAGVDAATYSIEDVPWVQYFSNGVALHGAFWHRRFGNVTSHGCVNLAPLDAMSLFDWTLPRLPRGWDASFPTSAEPATVVRVR